MKGRETVSFSVQIRNTYHIPNSDKIPEIYLLRSKFVFIFISIQKTMLKRCERSKSYEKEFHLVIIIMFAKEYIFIYRIWQIKGK